VKLRGNKKHPEIRKFLKIQIKNKEIAIFISAKNFLTFNLVFLLNRKR
jgi:hypothetical protein